jgi:DtxR family transcriptional regulator, Mn-dependent transcriptional regulator
MHTFYRYAFFCRTIGGLWKLKNRAFWWYNPFIRLSIWGICALPESGENYLETILILSQRTGFVRSVDVAHELGYSKPSISRAMAILKNKGHIHIEEDGNIILTTQGRNMACAILERHHTIAQYLMRALKIPEEIAEMDACRIEHIISEMTFLRIKNWLSENGSA